MSGASNELDLLVLAARLIGAPRGRFVDVLADGQSRIDIQLGDQRVRVWIEWFDPTPGRTQWHRKDPRDRQVENVTVGPFTWTGRTIVLYDDSYEWNVEFRDDIDTDWGDEIPADLNAALTNARVA